MSDLRNIFSFVLTIIFSMFTVAVMGGSDGAYANGGDYARERTVYITVDDGPLNGVDNVVSVLEQEQAVATFFLVGMHIEASAGHRAEFERAEASPNVLIGNHSYSHAHDRYRHFYSSSTGVLADMERNNKILGFSRPPFYSRLPGRDVFRTPGLSSEDPFLTPSEDRREKKDFDFLWKKGFYIYGWDLEWAHETTGRPVQSVEKLMSQIREKFENNRTKVKGHLVLLMHDEMFSDELDGKQTFGKLVRSLKAEGYKLAKIDQYPSNR